MIRTGHSIIYVSNLFQVNSIQDIGESAYSQWTKLKKLENENVNVAATDSNEFTQTWQPTAKRCLYLTMTDGSQKVFGMEMQIIRGLDVNMKPGFKVECCCCIVFKDLKPR